MIVRKWFRYFSCKNFVLMIVYPRSKSPLPKEDTSHCTYPHACRESCISFNLFFWIPFHMSLAAPGLDFNFCSACLCRVTHWLCLCLLPQGVTKEIIKEGSGETCPKGSKITVCAFTNFLAVLIYAKDILTCFCFLPGALHWQAGRWQKILVN
jgi:hypothetical protein